MAKYSIVPAIFSEITISEAVELFIRAKSDEGRRSGTMITYIRTNRELVGFLGAERLLLSINASDLRAFFGLLRENHNVGGVHHYYRNIKAFFNWFWIEYEVDKFNPILKVKVEAQKPIPRAGIPLGDFEKLIRACNTTNRLRDLAVLYGLLDTCARGSEFCALTVDNVDINTGQTLIIEGKGGKSRYVRFGVKSLRALRKYLRTRGLLSNGDPLIASDEGEFLKYRSLHRLVQRRIEAAGIPQYGLHAFRRRGLYEMWKRTRDLKGVSVYAGHSNTTVTQVYLGITEQDILGLHRQAGAVDHWL